MSETRLRLIEALTRTDGAMARNNPDEFIKAVETLHEYVIKGRQPKAEAPVTRSRSKRR